MATITFRQIIIGFFIVSLMVALPVVLLSDLETNYGFATEGNISSIYDRLKTNYTSTYDVVKDVQEKVETEGGWTVIDAATILTSGTISAIKLPFKLIGVLTTFMSASLVVIGLPHDITKIVLDCIIAMFVVTIVFMVLRAWLRSDVL